jgi:peptidoglycan/LPS O-acetylase OafA/YrhL
VLFAHLTNKAFTDGYLNGPTEIGYSSVMIFFVLSGYVITYVAFERETHLIDFTVSRLARVYSVVIPALFLTVFTDVLLLRMHPINNSDELLGMMPLYEYRKIYAYFLVSLVFGNNIWGARIPAFSNGVWWSMCFEVYYYVIFAVAFYLTGWKRVSLLCISLLAVGPGPLLRFHLWLFGFGVYILHRRKTNVSTGWARVIFGASLAFLVLDLATDLNLRIDMLMNVGLHSEFRRLTGDTLTGLAVATNIFAAQYMRLKLGLFGRLSAYFASFSFSLYLMHVPLLRLWTAYWHPDPVATAALVLVSVWLLGQITEKQKDHLRNLLRRQVADRFWPKRIGATG